MIRNPRFWFAVAGGWLVFAGLAHAISHMWSLVLENGMMGLREFAMNAMKQAQSPDPLRPSLWRQFRLFSTSFALLLIFAGGIDLLLARVKAPARTLRDVALFATVFWTLAFVPFALIDPVIQAIAVALIAVPLHGIAYVTAAAEVEAEPAEVDPAA